MQLQLYNKCMVHAHFCHGTMAMTTRNHDGDESGDGDDSDDDDTL